MKFRVKPLIKNIFVTLISNTIFVLVPLMLFSFILITLSPLPIRAQQTGVTVGDRVRIVAPSMQKRPLVGLLGESNDYGIMLHSTDSTYFIPHSSVRKLSVSTGKKRNIAKGAAIGLLSGAAVGGLIGILSYEECTEEGFLACFMVPENKGQAFALGAAVGFIPGTLIGIAIGSAKTDRWEKVPTKMLLQVKPVGRLHFVSKPQLTFRWSIGSNK